MSNLFLYFLQFLMDQDYNDVMFYLSQVRFDHIFLPQPAINLMTRPHADLEAAGRARVVGDDL